MTTIYALLNPVTNSPFYIGSTSRPITKRLNEHIWENISQSYRGVQEAKKQMILRIIKSGRLPIIKKVAVCSDDNAHKVERAMYEKFKKEGCLLLQKNSFCSRVSSFKIEKVETGVIVAIESHPNFDKADFKILQIMANGGSAKEAAKEVFLSVRTVETRTQNIKSELGAVTLAHLMSICFKSGILGFEIDSSSD
jgi:DNA-binding CsgD family transcriptional regulator